MPSTFLGRHHTEEAKRKLREFNNGKSSPMLGKHHTEAAKRKLSEFNKGKPSPMLGKHHTEENKAKFRACHLGTHPSEETRVKLRESHKGERNYWYGKHHTEESKAKIGRFHLGKPLSEEHKAKISKANKGRKLSEEQRIKLSKNNIGKHLKEEIKIKLRQIAKEQWNKARLDNRLIGFMGRHHGDGFKAKMTGEKHPHWQGGISVEPYTKEFNTQLKWLIRMRDAFTCQLCGMPECEHGRALTTHHIDYNKKNSLPNNLIALCTSCNFKVNNDRAYWTNYFRDLLNQRQLNPKAFKNKRNFVSNLTQEEIVTFVGTGV